MCDQHWMQGPALGLALHCHGAKVEGLNSKAGAGLPQSSGSVLQSMQTRRFRKGRLQVSDEGICGVWALGFSLKGSSCNTWELAKCLPTGSHCWHLARSLGTLHHFNLRCVYWGVAFCCWLSGNYRSQHAPSLVTRREQRERGTTGFVVSVLATFGFCCNSEGL